MIHKKYNKVQGVQIKINKLTLTSGLETLIRKSYRHQEASDKVTALAHFCSVSFNGQNRRGSIITKYVIPNGTE